MGSKADILADLRASVAAIERGDAQSLEGRAEISPVQHGRSAMASTGSRRSGAAPCPSFAKCSDDSCSASRASQEGDGGDADEAFRKVLRWVAVRERSSTYVRERLLKDGFTTEAVDDALERAVRVHAVDDRRYGDALIRMKLASGRGLRDAEAEIASLGIDPASLDAWQEHDAQGSDIEIERALALLQRRPPRSKRPREAAFRKLVGQGFSSSVASTAARRWSEGLSLPDESF